MKEAAFDGLVGCIYAAAWVPDGWLGLLEQLRIAFGASDAALLAWDARTGQPRLAAVRPEPVAEYLRNWDTFNILKEPGLRLPPGSVVRDRDLRPRDVLERSDYYNGFLSPHDMAHLMVLKLSQSCLGGTVINVTRGGSDGFSHHDIRSAQRLMAHVQRAVALADRMDWRCAELPGLVDRLPSAIILADGQGRPLYLNAAAEEIVAVADGLGVGPDGLTGAHPGVTARLRTLLADAGSGQGGELALPRPSGARPYALLAAPLPPDVDWLQRARPSVLVSVADMGSRPTPAPSQLRVLFGLSPSEAALALRIAAGDELGEIAADAGITVASARQYLARVFRKTSTRRQHDLAGLLVALGARTGIRNLRPGD